MYITNNNIRYPCAGYSPAQDTVRYSGVEGLALPATGSVTLYRDDGFELAAVSAADFARQTYEGGVLTLTNAPEVVPVEPEPDIEMIQADKLTEVGASCQQAIYAGVEVGGYAYALTEHDQIEIMAQQAAVLAGAVAVPYHADGELCRMYPADEFMAVANAATAYIFYHRTYCNHLNAWIRRTESVDDLSAITYGVTLPADLAENMAGILAQAGGGV